MTIEFSNVRKGNEAISSVLSNKTIESLNRPDFLVRTCIAEVFAIAIKNIKRRIL